MLTKSSFAVCHILIFLLTHSHFIFSMLVITDPTKITPKKLFEKVPSFPSLKTMSPVGTVGNDWRKCWLSRLGEGCNWHLVGGGQGRCSTPHNSRQRNADDGPQQMTASTAENSLTPNTDSARTGKF